MSSVVKVGGLEVVAHPFLVMDAAAYWCLHCERVSLATEWRANGWRCPYSDCDGSGLDAFAFGDFEPGKCYPVEVVWSEDEP